MVPASGVEILKDLRRVPSLQQVVHLVLLPPGQGLAQDLSRFIHVEVSGPQEAQDVLVLRDLGRRGRRSQIIQFLCSDSNADSEKHLHLSLMSLLKPLAQSDQTALLQGGQVTQVTFNVVSIQLICNRVEYFKMLEEPVQGSPGRSR